MQYFIKSILACLLFFRISFAVCQHGDKLSLSYEQVKDSILNEKKYQDSPLFDDTYIGVNQIIQLGKDTILVEKTFSFNDTVCSMETIKFSLEYREAWVKFLLNNAWIQDIPRGKSFFYKKINGKNIRGFLLTYPVDKICKYQVTFSD